MGETNSLVEEIVLMGQTTYLSILQRETDQDYNLVNQAFEKADMISFIQRKFQSLSSGEKQRVILRALVQEHKILILDEPTNHLDIKQQLQILSIAKQLNITVLAAPPDLSMTSHLCDYIYFLEDGDIIACGSPKETINEENILNIYSVNCKISIY